MKKIHEPIAARAAAPVGSSRSGYGLSYAMNHPYKKPHPHKIPEGWRWLDIGEYIRGDDVACDPRLPPVRIVGGFHSDRFTSNHHPVRRKILEVKENE